MNDVSFGTDYSKHFLVIGIAAAAVFAIACLWTYWSANPHAIVDPASKLPSLIQHG